MHPTAVRRRRRTALVVLALVIAGCGAGCGSSDSAEPASTTKAAAVTTTPSTEVVKDILGTEVDPPGADGSTLTLIRYTIPPGAKLAPHIHPGVQMARITSGDLTYTVVDGTAIVRRKGATEDEELEAPTTTTLEPGDTVTELDGMVHFGANDTDEPVVIDATLLTADGRDLAIPVTTTTP